MEQIKKMRDQHHHQACHHGPSASNAKSTQNLTENIDLQKTSSSHEIQQSTSQISTPGRRKLRRVSQAPDWLIEMREKGENFWNSKSSW
ncbi:hypothetical protein ACF0H5_020546 [Mactra antiquata]